MLTLALFTLWLTLSIKPWGQGIEPCVGSWPDLACTGETVASDSYCYCLPKGKRDQKRMGANSVLEFKQSKFELMESLLSKYKGLIELNN